MKSQQKRKERNNIVIILTIILIFIFSIYLYFNVYSKPLKVQKYDVEFVVNQSFGFDLNNTALKFGQTIPGSTLNRELNVLNEYDFPIKLDMLVSKNIADVVYIDDHIIVGPGQVVSFPVKVHVPSNYSFGVYTGEIIINFRKA